MAFLDLERLGLATAFYPSTIYVARRREAAKLGYTANEDGVTTLDVELDALLGPYKRAVRGGPGDLAARPHGSPSKGRLLKDSPKIPLL